MNDDGLIRCAWADVRSGSDAELYRNYHDHEWARPLRDGMALFERMSLEAFQSGLSWLIILRKRENFRRAFSGFDVEKVARYTVTDVQRLLADDALVRDLRAKGLERVRQFTWTRTAQLTLASYERALR